jgi:hypothetical protein
VSASQSALADQKTGRCPFLSGVLHITKPCVKSANSRGVCTISATSNGSRQDWLVCPYRALDDGLLADMTRRLYNLPTEAPVLLRPVPALDDAAERQKIMSALENSPGTRVFVYFQDKLGGEIGLPKTPASPDMSFDITVVELLAGGPSPAGSPEPQVRVGRYGVIEMQTTDTHGSYMQAVKALTGALDLHPASFHEQLAANAEWAGRKIEGPNISNVFKRTFYQISVKFQVTSRDTSAGCVLALPKPVWDSWQPFLGAPDLHQAPDGTWRLLDDRTATPNNWIYVFDISDEADPDGGTAPINVCLVIGTDAPTLSRAAFDVAPAKAVEHGAGTDAVVSSIVRRLRAHIPVVLTQQ